MGSMRNSRKLPRKMATAYKTVSRGMSATKIA
jgi:hypothetical protein